MSQNTSVFVSHTRANEAVVRKTIIPALNAQNLDYHFINWGTLTVGREGGEHGDNIREEIRDSALFIVCISSEAIDSAWMAFEVDYAFQCRDAGSIFCMSLDGTPPSLLDKRLADVVLLTEASLGPQLCAFEERHLTIS